MNKSTIQIIISGLVAVIVTAGCSSSAESPSAEATTAPAQETAAAGIRLISAQDGAAIASNPPEDLVILDVRTEEEFAEGHIDGAVMIDFYSDDFADQIADLDPDVPYLLYCRSGNRSGQTTAIMQDLGFSDVADIDGGILSWSQAGLATVPG